jgi:hypothetical protein
MELLGGVDAPRCFMLVVDEYPFDKFVWSVDGQKRLFFFQVILLTKQL